MKLSQLYGKYLESKEFNVEEFDQKDNNPDYIILNNFILFFIVFFMKIV